MELHPLSACNLIQEAYMTGVDDFIEHQKAEDAKEAEVTKGRRRRIMIRRMSMLMLMPELERHPKCVKDWSQRFSLDRSLELRLS
jgi:hypothetical protein